MPTTQSSRNWDRRISTVTITDATSGATIYFTTNGTQSSVYSTRYRYTGSVVINATLTLNAMAVATGYNQSATGSAIYNIGSTKTATPTLTTANTPAFTPPAGTYTTAQTIVVSAYTPDTNNTGSTVYYTTDGSDPANSSTKILYQVPIVE